MRTISAKVYFIPLQDGATVAEQVEAFRKVYEASGAQRVIEPEDMVAIKLHVGEIHNTTHVKPDIARELVQQVKAKQGQPFLTETSTLYKGERENGIKHIMHAHKHGFGIDNVGAPFIMADGLAGNTEYEVVVNGELHKSVKVAREVMGADVLLAISHPTGHPAAGLGACLKNLGMGLSSRMGKMRQHSSMMPEVDTEKCRYCQKCIKWCPQSAIIEKEGHAYIMSETCIGCGECLAVCRFDAVKYDWNAESPTLQKSMAEHAYGVVKEKQGKCFYFNVLVDMTKGCDCFSEVQKKLIPDIGILASDDPVAIDKATMDLTAKANGQTLDKLAGKRNNGMVQIEHAAKIGMGSLEYELITVK